MSPQAELETSKEHRAKWQPSRGPHQLRGHGLACEGFKMLRVLEGIDGRVRVQGPDIRVSFGPRFSALTVPGEVLGMGRLEVKPTLEWK